MTAQEDLTTKIEQENIVLEDLNKTIWAFDLELIAIEKEN